jgi:hypothetical protein
MTLALWEPSPFFIACANSEEVKHLLPRVVGFFPASRVYAKLFVGLISSRELVEYKCFWTVAAYFPPCKIPQFRS